MKKNKIGHTDIFVSTLGLGTVKFGRNQQIKYPTPFNLPHDKAILDLLAIAKSSGINLLDTAPAYGTSEERLGKLLTDRKDWVICTKVGENFASGVSNFDFTRDGVNSSIEKSLKKLGTDYLDIVLVHSNGEDTQIIHETDIFATLAELKEKGVIRAFGMSTKTVDGGKLAVDFSDVVMVTYNPIDYQEKAVIDYAHQKNKGVFIKKALASGHLTTIPDTMRFVLQPQGISSVVVGTINPAHLVEIIKCTIL